jgi:hypothetical protein
MNNKNLEYLENAFIDKLHVTGMNFRWRMLYDGVK